MGFKILALLTVLAIAAFFIANWYTSGNDAQPKIRSIDKPDVRFGRRVSITAADENWREIFMADCESPAETAFLKAMIEGFGLLPNKGMLQGSGLVLNFQVEIARYRADFFANGWLVIEVDGAAYHSSPEAVARDQKRDQFMAGAGYTVLRIPAKVVFNQPKEAVEAVRAALAKGAKPAPVQEVVKRKTVGEVLDGFSKAVSTLERHVDLSLAVQKAMSEAQTSFSSEKIAIDAAMEIADRKMIVGKYRAQSEQHRKDFDDNYALILKAIENSRDGAATSKPAVIQVIEPIKPIMPPQRHDDAAIDDAIQRRYQSLVQERSLFLSKVRNKLSGNAEFAEHVRSALVEISRSECWVTVSGEAAPTSPQKSARVTVEALLATVRAAAPDK